MTTTSESDGVEQARRLGPALAGRLAQLQHEYLNGSSRAKATLAGLRRGVAKPAGSVPEIWEMTIAAVPRHLQGGDHPGAPESSRAEQSAHAVMTLYALHQQSLSKPVHVPGVSFGSAVARLRSSDQRSEEAVTRRFMAVTTAESAEEALWHMRGLITQLRSEHVGLDYARLADDLVGLLTPGRAIRVRLAWGRDFYRSTETGERTSPDVTNTDTINNDDQE